MEFVKKFDTFIVSCFALCMMVYVIIYGTFIHHVLASNDPIGESTLAMTVGLQYMNILSPILLLIHIILMFIRKHQFIGARIGEILVSFFVPFTAFKKYYIRSSHTHKFLYVAVAMISLLACMFVIGHVLAPLWDPLNHAGAFTSFAFDDFYASNELFFIILTSWFVINCIFVFVPAKEHTRSHHSSHRRK